VEGREVLPAAVDKTWACT